MKEQTILVVEDDDRLRRFVRSNLEKAGYSVEEAPSGKAALALLKERFLDLVLLDIRLGDMSGIEILKTIRRQDEALPVILVSSISDQEIKLNGLSIGCDDYVTKPFYIEELLLRVARVLARARLRPSGSLIATSPIVCGPFEIDVGSFSVKKRGSPVIMRKKLFDLFLFFVRHPDTVLSAGSLFGGAWIDSEETNENSLYVNIRELRKLVEDDPAKPCFIRTIRNAGYLFSVKEP